MDQWKVIQVSVISGVLTATGIEVLERNPGDNPHTENETQRPDQPLGRLVIEARTSGTPLQAHAWSHVTVGDTGMLYFIPK